MPTLSLDPDDFTALCEQLVAEARGPRVPARSERREPRYRGLWARFGDPEAQRRPRLRGGLGFPRGRR